MIHFQPVFLFLFLELHFKLFKIKDFEFDSLRIDLTVKLVVINLFGLNGPTLRRSAYHMQPT
jgi:hypothetical protein